MRNRSLFLALAALAMPGLAPPQVLAETGDFGVGQRAMTVIDTARSTKASGAFVGASERRLDLKIWYPATRGGAEAARGGPWPLVIYAHGTMGVGDNAMHIVRDLVARGYVVAAPNFPLTSPASSTKVAAPDLTDVVNQTKDISVIIDRLQADPQVRPMIEGRKIGVMGHSLGAVTSYFTVFGSRTRDPRIDAAVLLGAGDPVQAALSNDMGLTGSWPAPVHTPVLFLSAEKDVFANLTGGPFAAYARSPAPKYEIMVKRGTHVWFRDATERPADNRNPDCAFFDRAGMKLPACDERVPLIDTERQHVITRTAVRAFFDAYLKDDPTGLRRLLAIDRQFGGDTRTLHEDMPAAR